jgi:hypothetical protein
MDNKEISYKIALLTVSLGFILSLPFQYNSAMESAYESFYAGILLGLSYIIILPIVIISLLSMLVYNYRKRAAPKYIKIWSITFGAIILVYSILVPTLFFAVKVSVYYVIISILSAMYLYFSIRLKIK